MKNDEFISHMIDASRNESRSFEDFFQWKKYQPDEGAYFMPPELLSIYDTDIYNELSHDQIRALTRIEAIQTLYLYAYTESVMCYYMARHLVKSDF